ncbi:SulP family inorganic anion transporter [Prochlorothrix hollandica]|uniref:STAS domain-containing protein n=1 Tax=Prochlorothrix hollandica PCC 9006 = CALU 1027 TaxID=317619 RepID=A0A0M2Q1X7_PROHO|nr:SulP family inorganic anion transporter [Prochlorothrix hollandica]KKJ00964.1 hypothetical protein PROH_00535 [Prochlorothrix hollandica PCC 9006 = CALU 1027]
MTLTPHPSPTPYSVPAIQNWFQDLQPSHIIASCTAGLITAIIGVIRAISYAALIFSGSLAVHLDLGIGMAILSSAVISVVVTFTSSLPGMIATPLAAPTAVLSILAAGLAQDLIGQVPPQTVALTVIAAIALGSLCTGAFLWLLGQFKLARTVQFIPYPVIGGFMAGTGWLLIRGAFEVITDESLKFATVLDICRGTCLAQWLTGLVIGTALLVISKQFKHYLAMPLSLLAAIGLFYGVLLWQGVSIGEARSAGWLLGTFKADHLWHPLSLGDLSQVQWGAIAAHWDSIALLMFVSLLSLVLTNNGIELSVGKDLDLDQELKSIGLANFLAGLSSSMAGNQALPSTLLVYKMGASYRLVGLVKALCCLGVLLAGSAFLPFLPKPILGSLLVYLGLNLLFQWLYESRSQFSTFDYGIILVTMGVINYFGFLEGILTGFVLVLLEFLSRYSQLTVVQDSPAAVNPTADPAANPATIDAASPALTLDPHACGVLPIHLQGFLFFGNANSLLTQVRALTQPPSPPLPGNSPNPDYRYLMLDFAQVHGLDASAVLSFQRIMQFAYQKNLGVIYTNVAPPLQTQLMRGQALSQQDNRCHLFPSVQAGLAWCQAQGS